MGNTCYLNAAMQCLAHTDQLKLVFLSKSYQADVNVVNPMGHQGHVAETFADLMMSLWKVCTGCGLACPSAFAHDILC